MNTEDYLTEARQMVEKDWPQNTLPALKDALDANDRAVLDRTNKKKDPLFDVVHHLANIRGYMRWFLLPGFLEKKIKGGAFPGIVSRWTPLGKGGIYVYEMVGQYTIVTPCHLLAKELSPRKSFYRSDYQIHNRMNPYLKGLEPDEAKDNRMRIVLCYGGSEGEFAYFRAYTNPKDGSIYEELTNNIRVIPDIPSIDEESVSPKPIVTLKTPPRPVPASGRGSKRTKISDDHSGSSLLTNPQRLSDKRKDEQPIP